MVELDKWMDSQDFARYLLAGFKKRGERLC